MFKTAYLNVHVGTQSESAQCDTHYRQRYTKIYCNILSMLSHSLIATAWRVLPFWKHEASIE